MIERKNFIAKADEEDICCGKGVEWDQHITLDAGPNDTHRLYGTCGRCNRRLYIEERGKPWLQLDDLDWRLNSKTF